jgi:hypothetical protein
MNKFSVFCTCVIFLQACSSQGFQSDSSTLRSKNNLVTVFAEQEKSSNKIRLKKFRNEVELIGLDQRYRDTYSFVASYPKTGKQVLINLKKHQRSNQRIFIPIKIFRYLTVGDQQDILVDFYPISQLSAEPYLFATVFNLSENAINRFR